MFLLVTKAHCDTPVTFGAKLSFDNCFNSNFDWCRELYIEYQKKRVHMVHDARVAFELSTVLSKEVTA